MQIETKSYVKLYFYNKNKIETTVVETIERNPLLFIKRSKFIIGLKFFDIDETTLENGKKIYSNKKNISPMYYYGKRVKKSGLKKFELYLKLNLDTKNFDEKEAKTVIFCDSGYIETNPLKNSITALEYLKNDLEIKQKVKK